jgi:hypothetical protein
VASSHAGILAIGDFVALTGTANATTGVAEIDIGAAGSPLLGQIAGFIPDYSTENFTDAGGLAAGVAGLALVNDDFRGQYIADVSNGPFAVADVGLNCNLLATVATKSGGLTISNMTVNATGKATTATLNFNIVGLLPDDAGVLGNRALVELNSTVSVAGAAGL